MIYLTKIVENLGIGDKPIGSRTGAVRPPSVSVPSKAVSQQEQQEQLPERLTVDEKKKLLELTAKINEFGKAVYREGNLLEVAQALQDISNLSERYITAECQDVVEANTVKRNITEMKKYCDSFVKLASEIHQKQQQMEALFEDYSRIADRYFEIREIQEIHDAVPTSKSVNKAEASLVDPRTPIANDR